jgi:hypothetical protein
MQFNPKVIEGLKSKIMHASNPSNSGEGGRRIVHLRPAQERVAARQTP